MKKIILSAVIFCLASLGASAKISLISINNVNGTNIILYDDKAPENVKVTDAVFSNNGHEYKAKEIRCDHADGAATYKLKFKRLTYFDKCKVILTINGKKIVVNILE